MDNGTETVKVNHQGYVDPAAAREQALLKKIMGLNNQKTLIESAPNFFSEKDEEIDERPA